MDMTQLGAGSPPKMPIPATGVTAALHESLINNALDSLELAGQTLSESQLRSAIEQKLTNITGRAFRFPQPANPGGTLQPSGPTLSAPGYERTVFRSQDDDDDEESDDDEDDDEESSEPREATFIFDSIDPIRVKFVDGGMTVILRTGVKQEGEKEIPPQEITLPVTITRMGDQLVLSSEPGEAKITPLTTRERLRQLAIAAQLRRTLEARLPKSTTTTLQSFQIPIEGKAPMWMSVTDFVVSNGWITLTAQ